MVSIDITYDCNFRCLHCYNSSGEHNQDSKRELTDKELYQLAEEIRDTKAVVACICGGEPLLRIDAALKVGEIVTSNGITKVNMVTNGWLMTSEIAQKIKEAGFTNVQVSLDGANPETHDWLRNRKGAFHKVLKAIEYLTAAGVSTCISFCPSIMNLSELNGICSIAEKYGIDLVRVQPLMVMGRASKNLKKYVLSEFDYYEIKKLIYEQKHSNSAVTIEWGDPIDHMLRYTTIGNGDSISVSVDPYGDIFISPYIPICIDNIRNHSFTYTWENSLKGIWKDGYIVSVAKNIVSPELMELRNILCRRLGGDDYYINLQTLKEQMSLAEWNRLINTCLEEIT